MHRRGRWRCWRCWRRDRGADAGGADDCDGGLHLPVTVGVAAGTLPAGAMVPATISFPAATGGSTEREVVLTLDDPTATATVTAPVTAGLFTVAVRGSTEDEAIDEVLPLLPR